MYDQLLKKLATPGNIMTPTDQNDSNNVHTIVLYFPAVISETERDSTVNKG